MKTLWLLPVLLLILAFRGDVTGQGLPPPERGVAPANRNWTMTQTFEAGKRAGFAAIGSGATYMGVYVYDDQGNCVTWDDHGNFATRDDLAVTWYPPRTANYTVEVWNFGRKRNIFEYSVRQSK